MQMEEDTVFSKATWKVELS